jgi:hypothetical protein
MLDLKFPLWFRLLMTLKKAQSLLKNFRRFADDHFVSWLTIFLRIFYYRITQPTYSRRGMYNQNFLKSAVTKI